MTTETADPLLFVIQRRNRMEINTDPQRRCYYGAHAKSELIWTEWYDLDARKSGSTREQVESFMQSFWIDLNDYAVSQRGESARSEFRIIEKTAKELRF